MANLLNNGLLNIPIWQRNLILVGITALAISFVFSVSPAYAQGPDWKWQNPLPTGSHLNGVWGSSGSDVFVVGEGGTILHYDGNSWTQMSSGKATWFDGVWGSSGSNVFTVGDDGTILHYDGSNWSQMNSGTTNYLGNVWGSSASNVFAVGSGGTILRYDGSNWSPMTSGTTNYLAGVWASSSSNVFAVGDGGTILHYNGSSWTAMNSGTNTDLEGVWGSSANDIFAVGYDTILHYNGSSWTTMNSGTSGTKLYRIWGSSSSNVFAVGDGGTILRYNGSSWTTMNSSIYTYILDVWGSSSSDVFAVSHDGTILHYDGSSWSSATSRITNTLSDVWGSSNSDVFASGGNPGTILHYDGTKWSAMYDPGTFAVDSIWGSSGSDVFAVTSNGTIFHYDGNNWSTMTSGTTPAWLVGIWGSSGSNVFAVGDNGTILKYNGSSWSVMNSGTSAWLYGVWGSSSSDVFAVGTNGTILHYNGSSWSTMNSGTTTTLHGVWGSSSSDVFAVGWDGTILHYNGSNWSLMNSGSYAGLRDVWGSSSNNVFAVGTNGTILHYDGSSWSAMSSGTNYPSLGGVWGSSGSDVFAVGWDGTILHYDGGISSISGRITDNSNNPITGVTISDGAGHTTATNSNGDYTLTGLNSASYTLTPSKSGYSFSPASRLVNVPPNATSQNFTAVLNTYSISGRITDNGGNPVSGVTISGDTEYTTTTDSNGNYTLAGLVAGSYTLTPSKSGYTFSPTSRNVSAPPTQTGQNFIGTTFPPPGDAYEPDNTCAQAGSIPTTGEVQAHTFALAADTDWVNFAVTAGDTYLIEAKVPPSSPADVALELYPQCNGLPQDNQDHVFSSGVRLEFPATTSGSIWLKLMNDDPAVGGDHVTYDLSVRTLNSVSSSGALILVAGRLKSNDLLQDNIETVASNVAELFQSHGYTNDQIFYLAPDLGLPGVDALPTTANLQAAITSWAVSRVGPNQPLTLYLVDHGDPNLFYLDKPLGQWITPDDLDSWLGQMEAARPGTPINVIIEACNSGSFIKKPQTLSRPGRVIIASTGATSFARASSTGIIFSDHFITGLKQGSSLYNSFQSAQWAANNAYPSQTPWLDSNGNGIANEAADMDLAAQRGFGYAGTLSGEQWSPYIVQASPPDNLTDGQGVIRANVLDDVRVRRVWAVIYPPSYQPPADSTELVSETLPTIVLLSQGDDWYGATYTGFDEAGTYRVVIYAEDDNSLEAQPVAIEVQAIQQRVYLPIVIK